MVAINFSVFTDKVAAHTKRQTIRKTDRNGQIRAGVNLQLYKGMRTSNCHKLVADDPVCVSADEIFIYKDWFALGYHRDGEKVLEPFIDCSFLHTFARRDGFETWQDMLSFFDKAYGLPFKGVLIKWDWPA